MIEYVEVRRKSDREIIGIVDGAKSVIWHKVYYGVGDFEIYAVASQKHIELLVEGNYITRPNDDEIGVIESVTSETNSDGTMLVVSGRFAKSILDRRHIYKLSGNTNQVTILSGNVETAVRNVVTKNIISSTDNSRNISFIELGSSAGTSKTIVDENGQAAEKQVSFDNLLEYTDQVLEEYKLGATVKLNDSNNKFQYCVYEGSDRSIDNTSSNEPIIFSKEYDNLTESTYKQDISPKKTSALVGGEGEGKDRFYVLIAGTETGIDKREMWVDASSVSKTYQDAQGTDHTYTNAQYIKVLKSQGLQELANNVAEEEFEGTINVNGGVWRINEDYFCGDIVTFQDNTLGKYANVRITELSEVQDENGYVITPVFDFEAGEVEVVVALMAENSNVLMTESGLVIQPEFATTTLSSSSSNSSVSGVKISELPESTDIYDGCCMPIVTYGETKKVYYSMLKESISEDLDIEAIPQSVIENL